MNNQVVNQSYVPTAAPNSFGSKLEISTLSDAYAFAETVINGGYAPKGATHASIVISMQMGAEVGLKPMASIQNIAVINGRPSIWGDASIAVCQQHPLFEGIEEIKIGQERTDSFGYRCTIKRQGMEPHVVEFTVGMAKTANLWGKQGPWKQYPFRMLQMRARGFAMRDRFSDSLKGMILREEADDMPVEKNITAQATDEPAKSVLDRNKPIQEPVQETTTVEAVVVEEQPQDTQPETISVSDIVKAVGLPKEQILEYHQAMQDPNWRVEKSLAELKEQARVYIMANTEQVKQGVQKYINSKPQLINAEQLKRLQTIKSASGKTEVYFKEYLLGVHNLTSSKAVLDGVMYDTVCNWLETAPNAK